MDQQIVRTYKLPIDFAQQVTPFILPKPFRHPSLFCISGTTGAGKTTWVYKFLQNITNMFENETPKHVLYCYGIYQEIYDTMEKEFNFLTFHEGIPDKDTILNLSSPSMIILDDLAHKVYQNIDMPGWTAPAAYSPPI